jgi:hypothetical protein
MHASVPASYPSFGLEIYCYIREHYFRLLLCYFKRLRFLLFLSSLLLFSPRKFVVLCYHVENCFVHEDDKLIFIFNFCLHIFGVLSPEDFCNEILIEPLLIVSFTAYGNRVKFETVDKIITPNPPVQVIDQCYDQGYGSERSPEDEMPPSLPILGVEQQYNPMIVNAVMMPQGYLDASSSQMLEMEAHQRLHQHSVQQNYDFITEGKSPGSPLRSKVD